MLMSIDQVQNGLNFHNPFDSRNRVNNVKNEIGSHGLLDRYLKLAPISYCCSFRDKIRVHLNFGKTQLGNN